MRALAIVLASTMPLLASALPALGQEAKADAVRTFIEKQATAFSEAFARADFRSLAAMYAEDAIVFPPDADMVQGRAAIETFWKSVYDSGVTGATLTVIDVKASGGMAAEVGRAVLTIKPPNQPEAKQNVKYVVVWKRQKDGSWKLYRDIWNAMPQQVTQ